jgi:hypothetical protein
MGWPSAVQTWWIAGRQADRGQGPDHAPLRSARAGQQQAVFGGQLPGVSLLDHVRLSPRAEALDRRRNGLRHAQPGSLSG